MIPKTTKDNLSREDVEEVCDLLDDLVERLFLVSRTVTYDLLSTFANGDPEEYHDAIATFSGIVCDLYASRGQEILAIYKQADAEHREVTK